MPTILIIGSLSDIAMSTSRKLIADGWDLYLTARDMDALNSFAKELSAQNSRKITTAFFDVEDIASHQKIWDNLNKDKFEIDAVLLASGYLGSQGAIEQTPELMIKSLRCNFVGPVSILSIIANTFEKRGYGAIIGISSVAGDRGRASNYFYGSSKAGLSAFLSGLRARLYKNGVDVITVKPGFVYTKMTSDKKLPALLTASADKVADDIIVAMKKHKMVIYSRWYWRLIMAFFKLLPESIAIRLKY